MYLYILLFFSFTPNITLLSIDIRRMFLLFFFFFQEWFLSPMLLFLSSPSILVHLVMLMSTRHSLFLFNFFLIFFFFIFYLNKFFSLHLSFSVKCPPTLIPLSQQYTCIYASSPSSSLSSSSSSAFLLFAYCFLSLMVLCFFDKLKG